MGQWLESDSSEYQSSLLRQTVFHGLAQINSAISHVFILLEDRFKYNKVLPYSMQRRNIQEAARVTRNTRGFSATGLTKQRSVSDDDPNHQVLLVYQDLFVEVLSLYHLGRPSSQDVYLPAVTGN